MSLSEEFGVRRRVYSDIQDYLPLLYRQSWQASARSAKPVLVELGVRSGNSTCALLAGLEKGGHGELWSVDIAEPDVPAGWRELPFWHLLVADDMSAAAQEWLPPVVDLLFIDTSHTYEQTYRELFTYVPRLKVDGVVLLHDTQWSSPDIALPQPTGPVAEALAEYCRFTGLRWTNVPGRYGMGVIGGL
jgi:predicted O-methyltransferase YrrM